MIKRKRIWPILENGIDRKPKLLEPDNIYHCDGIII